MVSPGNHDRFLLLTEIYDLRQLSIIIKHDWSDFHKKQMTPALLEVLFAFFEVSFEKPEDKNALIFFQLASLECGVVAFSL